MSNQPPGPVGKPPRNLTGSGSVTLPWDPAKMGASLEAIVNTVDQKVVDSINWYTKRKPHYRLASQWVRRIAVASVIATALLPMVAQWMKSSSDIAYTIDPIWATITLAIGVWAMWMDKFWGFSSTWMRFVQAFQRLTTMRSKFAIDWLAQRVSWAGAEPTKDEAAKAITMISAFSLGAEAVVDEETKQWITEFLDSLKLLSQSLQSRQEELSKSAGALAVSIKNFARFEQAWKLTLVDQRTEVECFGSTYAETGLAVGQLAVRVDATLKADGANPARPARAMAVVTIKSNETTMVEMDPQ